MNPAPSTAPRRPGSRSTRALRTTGWALVALVLGVGCGDDVTDDAPGGPGAEDIAGDWVLIEGVGPDGAVPIVDDFRPTLTIDGEDWGGTVCNHYGATVTVSDGDVTISDVHQTEMACLNGGVMESESAYLHAFSRVSNVEAVGTHLVLRGDQMELLYEAAPPELDEELIGTTWELESLVHGAGDDGAVSQAPSPARLVLREDGRLTGSTGCRQLAGPYHLDGSLLDLSEVTGDEAVCEDDRLVEQDRHVQEVLLSGTGIRVSLSGSRLELTAPGGLGLHYRGS